ncbi:MAG: tetratricopeptide repeat protein [Planctomycetota bacterium]
MRLLAQATRSSFLLPLLAGGLAAQADREAETFQVGIGLLQRELHDEAARRFEEFLRAHPDHALAAEANYRLATCRLELGDVAAAVTPLQKALRLGGAQFKLRAEAQYRLAEALHRTGRHADAHRAVSELLAETDGQHYLRAAAYFLQGECLRDDQHDAEAARAFLAAAEADTDEKGGHAVPARYQAGFALVRLGEFEAAETAFRAAAEGHPAHAACAECWYLAGDAAYRGGRFESALQAFQASEAMAGEFQDDAALGAAWATLQLGDRGAARTRFAHVSEAYPASPLVGKARLEVGRLQQQDGEHAQARATLTDLTRDGTDAGLRAEAAEIVGLAAAAAGEHDAALASLQSALPAAAPTARARILVAIGASLAAKSDWNAALQAYDQAGKCEPDSAVAGEALYGMCLASHRLGAYEESLRLAQHFLQEHGDHRLRVHAQLAVAENLFAAQRYAEAEAAYRPLEGDGGPFATDARFKRAWSVYLQGRQTEAADVFAQACADKDAAHAEEALSMLALAALEGGQTERALEAADRYKVRYPAGQFLARTERVASRSLQATGDLVAAASRLSAAAAAEGAPERSRQDRLEVAELMFKKSDFTGAATAYEDLITGEDGVAARSLEGAAWCAFELGDDEKCLRLVDRALIHPGLGERLPDALQLRCAVLQRTGKHDEAAATAARFVAECKGDARVASMRYAQGLSLLRADHPGEARQVLAALAGDGGGPNPDRTAYELAWACRKSGDEKAALAAFADVLRTTKDEELAGESALHLGEALLGEGNTEAARPLLLGVRGKHRARALYRAAFADLETQPARAQTTFAQILDEKLTGTFADDATFLVGEASQRAGDQTEAARRFAGALQALPDHERAQAARVRGGEAAVCAERPGDAVAWLEEFLRRDEATAGEVLQRARAQLWLGRARAARSEWKAAQAAFQRVTELTETELAAEAQFRLGEARRGGGDLEGAVDAFVKLSILYGHAEWVQRGLYEAGCCYRELGQAQKAERFFAELAQRFPDSPWTRRAKEGHVTEDKAPR